MSDNDIYEGLNDIFRDFFADSSIVLKPETTAKDIEGWDLLNHLSLMIAVELRFRVKFGTQEIEQVANVGELVSAIKRKLVYEPGV